VIFSCVVVFVIVVIAVIFVTVVDPDGTSFERSPARAQWHVPAGSRHH